MATFFDVYDELFDECQKTKLQQLEIQSHAPAPREDKISLMDKECIHSNHINEHGLTLCADCGLEIDTVNVEDIKCLDNSRHYIKKSHHKNIYGDITNVKISKDIKDIANTIYTQVCKRVRRGQFRKSIVFASIYYAYMLIDKPQSCVSLYKILGISRRDELRGLGYVKENVPKDSPIRTMDLTPDHLIEEYLTYFEVSDEICKNILDIYWKVEGISREIDSQIVSARPESVAAGVIWYWIVENGRNINIKDFTKKIGMSELTINKTSKEVRKIINLLNGYQTECFDK